MRYRSGEAIPYKAKAATVMSSSITKRLIITLGVRHFRGMERRKKGSLIVSLISFDLRDGDCGEEVFCRVVVNRLKIW